MSIFFEWIGFLLAYSLSQSHAARCGSLVGLGVTIALQSAVVTDYSQTTPFFKQYPDLGQLIGFLLAFTGYVLILYGFYSYQRVRDLARDRLAGRIF